MYALVLDIYAFRHSLDTSIMLHHFFPKKDMILPCPAALPAFAFGTLTAGFFLGTGSSSEKDSHVASSRVTVRD